MPRKTASYKQIGTVTYWSKVPDFRDVALCTYPLLQTSNMWMLSNTSPNVCTTCKLLLCSEFIAVFTNRDDIFHKIASYIDLSVNFIKINKIDV
jgi:hypothetical protein